MHERRRWNLIDRVSDIRQYHGAERGPDHKEMIEGFIDTQVTGRGLDGRTEKAYRLDLEHFYRWLEQERAAEAGPEGFGAGAEGAEAEGFGAGAEVEDPGTGRREKTWEEEIEAYLDHLLYGKGLRPSTISRKQRVLSYYLAYLAKQGALSGGQPLQRAQKKAVRSGDNLTGTVPGGAGSTSSRGLLSKKEVDLFFRAINREYEDLDSSFRKRVCLRDLVMMELLFYHGIEVSELLRMEVSDYDRKTGMLTVRRKRDRSYSVYLFSQELRERMGMWLEERTYFERDEEYRDRMFLSKLGRPLSMKMVIMIFDKYREMAGIREAFTPKDLKKSMKRYARELLMEWCG